MKLTKYTYDDSGLSPGEWTTSPIRLGGYSTIAIECDDAKAVAACMDAPDARAICQTKPALRRVWVSVCTSILCQNLDAVAHDEEWTWVQIGRDFDSPDLQILISAGVVKISQTEGK